MSIKEMTDRYLEKKGYHRTGGRDQDPAAIMPFFVLDLMYGEYERAVQPLKLRHEAKRLRRIWIENYTAMNKEFFSVFSLDEQDEIIEKMDSLREYVEHDLMIARIALMEEINDVPLDQQDAISAVVLCNILSQVAQIIWEKVYHVKGKWKNRSDRNGRIDEIVRNTHLLARNLPMWSDRSVNFNESKRVSDAVDILQNKIVKWMHEYERFQG